MKRVACINLFVVLYCIKLLLWIREAKDLNQRSLSYFLHVLEAGSIKRASDELMITPQGLSKTIQNLEKELGKKLFIRTRSGVRPTADALRLKPHAVHILNEFESLQKNLSQPEEPEELLTVAMTYGILDFINSEFISSFYREYPNVRLNLLEMPDSVIAEHLAKGRIDMAVLPAPLDSARFTGVPMMTARHCLLIHKSHPLAGKTSIRYSDLADQPLALKGRAYTIFNTNISRFLSAGVQPRIMIETSSDKLIHDLSEANLAVGVTLDYIAASDPRPSTVVIPFADKNCKRVLYAARRKEDTWDGAASFMKDMLIEHFRCYSSN